MVDLTSIQEFSQDDIWTVLEARAVLEPSADQDIWGVLEERLDVSRWKPKRILGYELQQMSTRQGEVYYLLKNTADKTLLKLTDSQVFIWNHLDGEHSVRDIALSYFQQYHAFAFTGIVSFLAQLRAAGFLQERSLNVFERTAQWFESRTLASRVGRLLQAFLRKEIPLKGVDAFVTAVYRRGGHFLFTRFLTTLILTTMVVGLVFFGLILAQRHYSFLSFRSSYALGIITIMLLNNVRTFFHEMGHALTCKHFGREVRKAGAMIYLGSLAFFVDTTDIWLGTRKQRILVSWGGPQSDFLFGAGASIILYLIPQWWGAQMLFMFATVSFLSGLFNLNPLLELDGYYILMDVLEVPCLRKKAFAFVTTRLLSKFTQRQPFSREEIVFTVYGLLAGAYTILTILLAVYLWQSRLARPLAGLLGESGSQILIWSVIGIILLIVLLPKLKALLPQLVRQARRL